MKRRYEDFIFIIILLYYEVRCQTPDMFEVHDKERGQMDLHVTRDKVTIDATSDSVSVVMNPDAARKRSGAGGIRSISRENTTSSALTISNIDQPDVAVKQNGVAVGGRRALDEKTYTGQVGNDENVGDRRAFDDKPYTKQVPNDGNKLDTSLPKSTSQIHADVVDFSVKRNTFPTQLFDSLRGDEPNYKVYSKHKTLQFEKPRDETGSKKTLQDTAGRRLFQIPHDVNGFKRRGDGASDDKTSDGEHAAKRSLNVRELFRGAKHTFKEWQRGAKHKDVNGTRRSIIHRDETPSSRSSKSDDVKEAKRSGMKEMTLHNELGGMHIKSDPQQTAVLSESGNLEITMVNEAGKASKKSSGLRTEEPKPAEESYTTGISRRIISHDTASDRSAEKEHLHIAEFDTGLKKSEVNLKHKQFVRSE